MAAAKSNGPEQVRDCLDPAHLVRQKIEAERRCLQKANAVLCLVHSASWSA